MIKVAIVEDDPSVVSQLTGYFRRMEQEDESNRFMVSTYKNAIIFLSEYKNDMDIVLMDIEMPHMDGMEAAEKLRQRDRQVTLIFVTNMAQFAVKGYQVNAFDFIVKPVQYYGFAMKIRTALREIKKNTTAIAQINTQDGLIRLPVQDLIYIESFEHSLTYHCDSGDYISKGRESLTEVLEKLSEYGFIRCKSCYLINIRYISRVTPKSVQLGDITLPISRTKKKEFMSQLAAFLAGGD